MLDELRAFFEEGNFMELLIPTVTNIVLAILIYIIGKWVAARMVQLIDKLMTLRNVDAVLRSFLVAILSTLFTFVVVLIAIEQLGVDTASLLVLFSAAGLAVGLAAKDSLSNFAAGVMLIIFKPFKSGDFVEAGGVAGVVETITVFNTIFRSGDNKEIIVPNAQIYGGTIVNYSARDTRRVDLVIGIGYGDDMKKARDLIWQVLNADERILQDPAPVVAVNELGESSVDFVVRPWVKSGDYWPVKWQFLESIKNTFDENGVSIPFPQRDIHVFQEASK